MKSMLSVLVLAASLTAIATAAGAHPHKPHQVCTWTHHHHHRVCQWVR